MSQNTLKRIVEYKRLELESARRKTSLKDVQLKANDVEPAIDFLKNFKENEVNIIAEVKKASPSAGIIREDFDPLKIAEIYEKNGAKAMSVLTDENFFKGCLDYLIQIKDRFSLPCLRKDFTLDEYHIWEARGARADAVLLIVAILDDYQLKDFQDLIWELEMTALIEVHTNEEMERALKISPKLLGINNRNLKTFQTNIQTSIDMIQKYEKYLADITVISESGLKNHNDLVKLMDARANGFLIGETLMRNENIDHALKGLIGS